MHAFDARRLVSVGASAGLFAALAAIALTTTLTARLLPPLDLGAPPISLVITPPPPQPAPPSPPRQPAQDAVIVAPAPPLATTTNTAVVDAVPTVVAASVPPTVQNPRWLRRPQDLERYYPRRAREMGRQGEVVLACLVSVEGALGCAVESETPAGWGFGEAALNIAADHRMAPATHDGRAVEARYRMVVPFRLR